MHYVWRKIDFISRDVCIFWLHQLTETKDTQNHNIEYPAQKPSIFGI